MVEENNPSFSGFFNYYYTNGQCGNQMLHFFSFDIYTNMTASTWK